MDFTTLHPVTIHIPLALAVLMPPFWGVLIYLVRSNRQGSSIWLVFWLASIVLVGSNGLAYWTGVTDAHLSAASVEALSRHQQLGLWFCINSFFIFGLASLRLYWASKDSIVLDTLILLALLLNVPLGIWLGHLGGALVF